MFTNTYKPINCDLHSHIEDFIVRKTKVTMCFLRENENVIVNDILLVDTWTKGGEEFIKTDSNETIRLDKIVSINGIKFDSESCKID